MVLAAICIAIFLFFLSVALIWTNRQDIALTLSLEHKLKAESAARSAAFEAFARLRQLGTLEGFTPMEFPSGAKAEVELLSLPAEGKRGEVLMLRAKGTSGPLSSYLTFYLRDVRIAGEANAGDGRVLFFPGGSSGGQALFGDFLLRDGGDVVSDMSAQAGPAFVARSLTSAAPAATETAAADPTDTNTTASGSGPSPPYFVDYVPVFSPDGQHLQAFGPTYIVAPPFNKQPYSATSLQYLEWTNNEFQWKDIDPPTQLGDEDQKLDSPKGLLEMQSIPQGLWSEAKIRGVGEKVNYQAWMATNPETKNPSDIPATRYSGNDVEATSLIEWGDAPKPAPQTKYVTRGECAASGNAVYTHAWHYLYRPYTENTAGELTPLMGSTLIRWPCILKYEIGGSWSIVWDQLKDSGTLDSTNRPDPTVIAVTDNGTVYTVTEPQTDVPRKLLTITGNKEQVGNEVPDGTIFAYHQQPYLLPTNPSTGIINIATKAKIDFSSLPNYLPEISGEVVDTSGAEQLQIGIEGGYQGEALDSSAKRTVTACPRYDFSYSATPGRPIAVDGDDLWMDVNITCQAQDPSYPAAYDETPFPTSKFTVTTLARYDGQRWHILPHGLRAALKATLAAPGQGVIAAVYPNLPKQVSRYSVIAIDTRPFKKGLR